MKSLIHFLSQPFTKLGVDATTALQATRDPKFGDYQCSAPLAAAKREGKPPRQLAQEWLDALKDDFSGVASLELAGPGFINLKLEDAFLAAQIQHWTPHQWESDRVPQTVVVDYSSPNVAKEMHVGHLRSTILGDAIVRFLEFAGHRVIRQNHLGDWGTQFGMLCAHLHDHPELVSDELSTIQNLYRDAHARFSSDPEFEARARATVVKLHQGDPKTLELWQQVIEQSRRHFQPLYQRLGVKLQRSDERGESFYNPMLEGVVAQLQELLSQRTQGVEVSYDQGALCAFHYDEKGQPLFLNRDNEPQPLLIRKSDGAFNYASTDLAAAKYRVQELKADRIIVITDARQALHFKQVILTLKAAGWLTTEQAAQVPYEHVTFGSILGPDRRPLKTRSGDTVRLCDLLDESVERAGKFLEENNHKLSPEEVAEVAEAVGIGSVKYADLSQNRSTDYIFQWEKLVSLVGNTAPYMMYAYARCRSTLAKAEQSVDDKVPIVIVDEAERSLIIGLLRFPESLDQVEPEWRINLLSDYLYNLAGLLMKFYDRCPVLKADSAELRASRLRLCDLTAQVLGKALDLLGIRALERM